MSPRASDVVVARSSGKEQGWEEDLLLFLIEGHWTFGEAAVLVATLPYPGTKDPLHPRLCL